MLPPVTPATVSTYMCQTHITNRQIYFAFSLGMAINLVSIYIGNPYLISLIVLPVALMATIKWMSQPLPWIVLVSVLAANPTNINTPISLNLIFASFFLLFYMRHLNRLPTWLYLPLLFAGLSVLGSVPSWGETGGVFTNLAAAVNYVVGPFFLIPLVYYRLSQEQDPALLLKIFLYTLIVPTVTFLLLARIFGAPMLDVNALKFDYLVNVSIYRLGNIDFQLTRTQVGIPLAVFICASFALVVRSAQKRVRFISLLVMVCSFFLLMVTGSVGSSLSAVGGMAVVIAFTWRKAPSKKTLLILPLLVVILLAGWHQTPRGLKDYIVSRYEEKVFGGIDTSDRSGRWLSSLNYLLENPNGRGWDLYVAPIGTYPHNDYLSYGIAFGPVCGLVYLYILLRLFLTLIRSRLRGIYPAQVAYTAACVGSVSVVLINSMADHLTANRWYFNVIWSIIWYGYFANKVVTGQSRATLGYQEGS